MNTSKFVRVLEIYFPDGIPRDAYVEVAKLALLIWTTLEEAPTTKPQGSAAPRPVPPPAPHRNHSRPRAEFKPYPKLRDALQKAFAAAGRPLSIKDAAHLAGMNASAVARAVPLLCEHVGDAEPKGPFNVSARLWLWKGQS